MMKSSNENNLVIEKYSKNNELQVKQLIDLYNEESYLFHLLRDNKTKCAYVAYYKKDVVGIFFTWGSNFHPYCTYFRIYTNPFLLTLVLLGLRIKKKRESDYTLSRFSDATSISNCTVIPLGSTTVNPFVISCISCCFSINLSLLHLMLLYAVIQSYIP